MTHRSGASPAHRIRSARSSRLLLWGLAALAVAFPAAAGLALHAAAGLAGTAGHVAISLAGLALQHPTASLTVAGLVLIARAFPRAARGLAGFLGAGAASAVRTVFA